MDNLDASKQSIPYIDQDEGGSDPSKEKTRNEQSITNTEDTPDSNNAENKRKTYKKIKGLSTAEKMRWQESLETEDEIDGTTIIQKTHESMRVTKFDDSETLITKFVHLNKNSVKRRRNDRYRTYNTSTELLYSFHLRENVRVADLTIQDDQEYFSDFVKMRYNFFFLYPIN